MEIEGADEQLRARKKELKVKVENLRERWEDENQHVEDDGRLTLIKEEKPGKDYAGAYADKLKTLKAAWDQYAKEVGVVPPE